MNNFTDKDLAYYWCQINRFKFAGFEKGEMNGIPAMRFIESLIGREKCLKEWRSEDRTLSVGREDQ